MLGQGENIVKVRKLRMVEILNRVIHGGLMKKVTFEKGPEEGGE